MRSRRRCNDRISGTAEDRCAAKHARILKGCWLQLKVHHNTHAAAGRLPVTMVQSMGGDKWGATTNFALLGLLG